MQVLYRLALRDFNNFEIVSERGKKKSDVADFFFTQSHSNQSGVILFTSPMMSL